MSLVPHPVYYDDIAERLLARRHNFGLGIHPHELEGLWCPRSWLNHRHTAYPLAKSDLASTQIGKDGFEVHLDVHQFAPNEIVVKTVDNTILVEATHEERQDEHGYISRQFKRRYVLPKEFNIEQVVSQLSSDGLLTIKAPAPPEAGDKSNVRVVQIQHTGPAHVAIGNKETKKHGETNTE